METDLLSKIDELIVCFDVPSKPNDYNKQINEKDLQKIVSYFIRNLNITSVPQTTVEIIYKYQRIIICYQLPSIPVTHSCIQAFKLNGAKDIILIQMGCTFWFYNTKTFKYSMVARLFPEIQVRYNYHSIYFSKQNKICLFHGKAPRGLVELTINDKFTLQNRNVIPFFCNVQDHTNSCTITKSHAFGMRSVILNEKYLLTFYGTNLVLCDNLTNDIGITVTTIDLPNNHIVSSSGVLSIGENIVLIFSNNAMYKVKFNIIEDLNLVVIQEIEKIENSLFTNDFILHEFGYVLCEKYILIFGGNYNDYENPMFSDDIYIYNMNENKFYKSKTKLPFKFNVKNNNIIFDEKNAMIHLIGANEFVDEIYCDPTEINEWSRCHLMFDFHLLIDKHNMIECINKQKKQMETKYKRCITMYSSEW